MPIILMDLKYDKTKSSIVNKTILEFVAGEIFTEIS